MYFIYVDESGDIGQVNSPSNYFVLSALIIDSNDWGSHLDSLIQLRQSFKSNFGLPLRTEIHASDFINAGYALKHLVPRHHRLLILKRCLEWINQPNIWAVNVRVDKTTQVQGADIFWLAWDRLLQRIENSLPNFAPGKDSHGLLFNDNTDDNKLRSLIRKRRRFNPVPHSQQFGGGYRMLNAQWILEDPNPRSSSESYFVQIADVLAYFIHQKYKPCLYVRKKGATNYYRIAQPRFWRQISRSGTGILEI